MLDIIPKLLPCLILEHIDRLHSHWDLHRLSESPLDHTRCTLTYRLKNLNIILLKIYRAYLISSYTLEL
jgi:hypothetical protein